jgi:hypothetical protein
MRYKTVYVDIAIKRMIVVIPIVSIVAKLCPQKRRGNYPKKRQKNSVNVNVKTVGRRIIAKINSA